jgi:hypothetical protein
MKGTLLDEWNSQIQEHVSQEHSFLLSECFLSDHYEENDFLAGMCQCSQLIMIACL